MIIKLYYCLIKKIQYIFKISSLFALLKKGRRDGIILSYLMLPLYFAADVIKYEQVHSNVKI